jgi:hypothetical protein
MVSFLSVPAFAINILANPYFETGTLSPKWYESATCGGVAGCVDWNVTTADNHTPSGSHSATVVTNETTSKGGAGPKLRQDFSAVPTSHIAHVSFWNRYPDASFRGADFQSSLDFLYSDSTHTSFAAHNSTAAWTFHHFTPDLLPGKDLVGIYISSQGDLSNTNTFRRMFLDDVIINAAPEPGSLALFATGFFGLGGLQILRRRR